MIIDVDTNKALSASHPEKPALDLEQFSMETKGATQTIPNNKWAGEAAGEPREVFEVVQDDFVDRDGREMAKESDYLRRSANAKQIEPVETNEGEWEGYANKVRLAAARDIRTGGRMAALYGVSAAASAIVNPLLCAAVGVAGLTPFGVAVIGVGGLALAVWGIGRAATGVMMENAIRRDALALKKQDALALEKAVEEFFKFDTGETVFSEITADTNSKRVPPKLIR